MSSEITIQSVYLPQQKTSCIRIHIQYPNTIGSMSYNFQLTVKIYKQNIIPKISFEQVYSQKYLVVKKHIQVQGLLPSKMYKVEVQWMKKGPTQKEEIKESKTQFIVTQSQKENDSQLLEQQSFDNDQQYGRFVKDNIHNYFQQYYHKSESSQQNQLINRKNTSLNYPNSSNSSNSNSLNQRTSSKNQMQQTTNQRTQYSKNKYKKTDKTPMCNSQMMMKMIGQSDPYINKKNLQKYIIEGRTSSSVKNYLTTKDLQCFNSYNKLYKNQVEKRKHVEKTLLVSKAISLFGEVYSFDRQYGINNSSTTSITNKNTTKSGNQFFKNDWFMGPFYSYDQNQVKMKSKKN